MAKCKHCDNEVSPTAKYCPNCGDQLLDIKTERIFNSLKLGFFKTKKTGCLFTMFLVFTISILLSICINNTTEQRVKQTKWPDKIAAYVMAQRCVEERLRSPSTAKFPWGAEQYTMYLGDGKYQIDAYVDSQNGFGAMIRNKFTCTIVSQDSGKTWSCMGCTLQEDLE